jgi:hypothetical protein
VALQWSYLGYSYFYTSDRETKQLSERTREGGTRLEVIHVGAGLHMELHHLHSFHSTINRPGGWVRGCVGELCNSMQSSRITTIAIMLRCYQIPNTNNTNHLNYPQCTLQSTCYCNCLVILGTHNIVDTARAPSNTTIPISSTPTHTYPLLLPTASNSATGWIGKQNI